MIEFILTNWWIYIPIILVLLFLIAKNNQKIKYAQQQKVLQETDPLKKQQKLKELKRSPSKLDKLTSKIGIKGILTYIFPKR